jgi:hypothetical protein
MYRCNAHSDHMFTLLVEGDEPVITQFMRRRGAILHSGADSWQLLSDCKPRFDNDFGLSGVNYVHVKATPEQFTDCERHQS